MGRQTTRCGTGSATRKHTHVEKLSPSGGGGQLGGWWGGGVGGTIKATLLIRTYRRIIETDESNGESLSQTDDSLRIQTQAVSSQLVQHPSVCLSVCLPMT